MPFSIDIFTPLGRFFLCYCSVLLSVRILRIALLMKSRCDKVRALVRVAETGDTAEAEAMLRNIRGKKKDAEEMLAKFLACEKDIQAGIAADNQRLNTPGLPPSTINTTKGSIEVSLRTLRTIAMQKERLESWDR